MQKYPPVHDNGSGDARERFRQRVDEIIRYCDAEIRRCEREEWLHRTIVSPLLVILVGGGGLLILTLWLYSQFYG
jgi:hypothetical protein